MPTRVHAWPAETFIHEQEALALDQKRERGKGYGCACLIMQVRAEVSAVEWKGGRGWGYCCACPNWVVVEVLALEWKGGRKWGYMLEYAGVVAVCVGTSRSEKLMSVVAGC